MVKLESIRTKDGKSIEARVYVPNEDSGRVIVISPSAYLTQKFYSDIACFFRDNHFTVVTFDFRGVGDSAPRSLRRFKANLENWAQQDIDAVLRYAKNQFPKQELIFLGHGIGGEIVGLAPACQFINRVILVSCALSSTRLRRWYEKTWISVMKIFVRIISWVFGYFPGKEFGFLNNLPKGVMDEWIRWCDNANGLFDDFPDQNYRKLQVPLLTFSFSDDWRSQQNGVKALLQHFTSACITWYHLKPKEIGKRRVGHSGFFKLNPQNRLWQPLLNWINDKKCDESDEFSLIKKQGISR
jgi:predicted alpha/beta hydrolase